MMFKTAFWSFLKQILLQERSANTAEPLLPKFMLQLIGSCIFPVLLELCDHMNSTDCPPSAISATFYYT